MKAKLKITSILFAGIITVGLLGALPTSFAASNTPAPTLEQVERQIGSQFKQDIQWNTAVSHGHSMKLSGQSVGADGTAKFKIDCTVSYPPLSIRCTITF